MISQSKRTQRYQVLHSNISLRLGIYLESSWVMNGTSAPQDNSRHSIL